MLSLTIHNLAPNVAGTAWFFSIIQDYAHSLTVRKKDHFNSKPYVSGYVSLSKDRLLFALSVIIFKRLGEYIRIILLFTAIYKQLAENHIKTHSCKAPLWVLSKKIQCPVTSKREDFLNITIWCSFKVVMSR